MEHIDKATSLYIALLDYTVSFVTFSDTNVATAFIKIRRPIPNVCVINVGNYTYEWAGNGNQPKVVRISVRSTYAHIKGEVEKYVLHKLDDINYILLCK